MMQFFESFDFLKQAIINLVVSFWDYIVELPIRSHAHGNKSRVGHEFWFKPPSDWYG